ncbi:MAG TPA: hypothetical protein PK491_07985 [Candidatus Hydrogenedentes bacterium]|nr:hypothetical protein [Candidatus Hydrogenedentota bacterium]
MNSSILVRLRPTLLFSKKQRILCYRPAEDTALSWLRTRRYNVEGPEPEKKAGSTLQNVRRYYDLVLIDQIRDAGALSEQNKEILRDGFNYVRPGGRMLLVSSFSEKVGAVPADKITEEVGIVLKGLPVLQIKPSKVSVTHGHVLHLIQKSGVYKSQLQVRYVDIQEEFNAICTALHKETLLGLDVETTLEEPRTLCTVQLASPHEVYVFDALKITDLEPLKHLMENEEILKIIHNKDFEQQILGEKGIAIHNIYDTLVHARKHYKKTDVGSYRLDDVCVRALNIYLDKHYQTSDWTRRPLMPEQIDYAAADAEVMIRLHRHFEPPPPPENLELF